MIVVDDFLPKEQFEAMQSFLLGADFPWYFLETVSRPPGSYVPPGAIETFGWFHNFYSKEDNSKSFALDYITPLLDKINDLENGTADFIRVRASLKTQKKGFTDKHYNVPHVDYDFQHTSVIYYLNESDGDTWMFSEELQFPEPDNFSVIKRVSPKPNRLLIFNGLQYHTASNPINSETRAIININYIKGITR